MMWRRTLMLVGFASSACAAPATTESAEPPAAQPAPAPADAPAAPAQPTPTAPADAAPTAPADAAPTAPADAPAAPANAVTEIKPASPPAPGSTDPLAGPASPAAPAGVDFGGPDGTSKTVDRDLIRRTIRGEIGRIRGCYEAGLKRDPTLRGRIDVSFTITKRGKTEVDKVQSDLKDGAKVESCVRDVVQSLTFPKPEEPVKVTYPFVLDPG